MGFIVFIKFRDLKGLGPHHAAEGLGFRGLGTRDKGSKWKRTWET